MEKYRQVREDQGGSSVDLPRILGLTATIINGKGSKKDSVQFQVEEAERKICARTASYHEYEEVLK